MFCPYAEFKAVGNKQYKNAIRCSDVNCSEQDFSHQPRHKFATETQKKNIFMEKLSQDTPKVLGTPSPTEQW